MCLGGSSTTDLHMADEVSIRHVGWAEVGALVERVVCDLDPNPPDVVLGIAAVASPSPRPWLTDSRMHAWG